MLLTGRTHKKGTRGLSFTPRIQRPTQIGTALTAADTNNLRGPLLVESSKNINGSQYSTPPFFLSVTNEIIYLDFPGHILPPCITFLPGVLLNHIDAPRS